MWEWILCNVYASQLATKEGERDIISIVFADFLIWKLINYHVSFLIPDDPMWESVLCNVFASQLATKKGERDIISIVFASQPAANYANEHRRRIDSPTCNLTPLPSPCSWDLPTKYYSHFHYEHAWIKSYVLATSKLRNSHSFLSLFIEILIEILILIFARLTH